MSYLEQFTGEITASTQIPYAQLVSPPNLNSAMLKRWQKEDGNFGLFISAEQAEIAGFMPDDTWQPTQVAFSSKEEFTPGFITKSPRFVVIHRSQAEVQYRADENSRFKFIDLYWKNGQKTVAGVEADKDKSLYKIVTRHLVLFLGADNRPLHSVPIQYTAKGAFASSLGTELNLLYSATGEVFGEYLKQNGVKSPGKALSAYAKAFTMMSMKIDIYRNDDKTSPFCYPSVVVHPSLKDTGSEVLNRKVKDKFRELTVKKVALEQVLLDMKSDAGELIKSWYQEYQEFPKPRIMQEMTEEIFGDEEGYRQRLYEEVNYEVGRKLMKDETETEIPY